MQDAQVTKSLLNRCTDWTGLSELSVHVCARGLFKRWSSFEQRILIRWRLNDETRFKTYLTQISTNGPSHKKMLLIPSILNRSLNLVHASLMTYLLCLTRAVIDLMILLIRKHWWFWRSTSIMLALCVKYWNPMFWLNYHFQVYSLLGQP